MNSDCSSDDGNSSSNLHTMTKTCEIEETILNCMAELGVIPLDSEIIVSNS